MRSTFASAVLLPAALFLGGCPGDETITSADSADAAGGAGGAHAGHSGVGGGGPGGGTSAAIGAGGGAAGGAGGDMGSGGSAPVVPFSPYGSFDLELSSVAVSIPMGPAQPSSPSAGAKLRLDLPPAPEHAASWTAVVTPRWGQPATFAVVMTDSGIVLTGSATISSGVGVPMASDVWQSFTLALDSAGKATGKVVASGQESVFGASNTGATGTVSAVGVLGLDVTPPEARPEGTTKFGPAGALLPWEPVSATFAEPIDMTQVAEFLSVVDDASGQALGFAPFSLLPDSPDVASSVLLSWSDAAASPRLHLEPGYADPSKNLGAGFDAGFAVVSVPKTTSLAKQFSSEIIDYASWGTVARVTADASYSGCAGGACLEIGPLANDFCGVERAGIAGRLLIPSPAIGSSGKKLAGQVRVRVRAMFAATADAPATVPYVVGLTPLSISLARPGRHGATYDVTSLPAAQDLGDQAGDLRFATPWTDVVLPLPAGATGAVSGEIGYALHLGGVDASSACTGPTSAPVTTKLVVESITIE